MNTGKAIPLLAAHDWHWATWRSLAPPTIDGCLTGTNGGCLHARLGIRSSTRLCLGLVSCALRCALSCLGLFGRKSCKRVVLSPCRPVVILALKPQSLVACELRCLRRETKR
jgi:hypothetical protein